jgi:hypothetical protein
MATELNPESLDAQKQDSIGKHLRLGWWFLLGFLTLGTVIEAMHGFKVGWLLDVSNETRRLLFRLAHAHGVLLGLVNIAFAFTLSILPSGPSGRRRLASTCLIAASILMPGGFLLGGIVIYGADPGLGIFLLPIGAAMLFVAVFLTAMATSSFGKSSSS